MPSTPINTKCRELGCKNPHTYRSAFCNEHGGAKTDKGKANGRLYNSKHWHQLRDIQLSSNPLCARCLANGRVLAANVVDHIFPHRQDYTRFRNNIFQSLCAPCHTLKTQDESKGIYYHYAQGKTYNDNDYQLVVGNMI